MAQPASAKANRRNIFSRLVDKIDYIKLHQRIKLELGGPDSDARALLNEYLRFLELKLIQEDYDATKLSPPELVDKVWHVHILDTLDYLHVNSNRRLAVGGRRYPRMVHHNPMGGIDQAQRARRYAHTYRLYTDLYGQEPPGPIWPRPDPIVAVSPPVLLPPASAPVDLTVDNPESAAKRKRPNHPADTFQVFLKTQAGNTLVLDVKSDDSVLKLKERLQEKEPAFTPDMVRIIFGGKQLEDSRILSDCGVIRESTLFIIMRLAGC